jgi:hypothetical protein
VQHVCVDVSVDVHSTPATPDTRASTRVSTAYLLQRAAHATRAHAAAPLRTSRHLHSITYKIGIMFDSSSSDEEEALLLLLCKDTPATSKRVWVHEINERRGEHSEYHNLCRELESHEDRFFWYFHMSRDSFEELHDLVRSHILKNDTNYRKAIRTRERLAVFLRFVTICKELPNYIKMCCCCLRFLRQWT